MIDFQRCARLGNSTLWTWCVLDNYEHGRVDTVSTPWRGKVANKATLLGYLATMFDISSCVFSCAINHLRSVRILDVMTGIVHPSDRSPYLLMRFTVSACKQTECK